MAEEQKIGSPMEQEILSDSEIDSDSDSDEELKKLEGDESEAAKLKKLNIKGRFNHENYEANKRFSSIEAF